MADSTVTIVGNLTRDPEIRYTTGGAAKASFGVAVSRRWQNRQSQEWEEQTSFFNVVCWREMAENVARVDRQGLARRRHRPARAAQLGDRQRRQAQRRRDRRRRGRPEPALGHREGRPQRASGCQRLRWRRGGGGSGGSRRRWRVRRAAAVAETSEPYDPSGEEPF